VFHIYCIQNNHLYVVYAGLMPLLPWTFYPEFLTFRVVLFQCSALLAEVFIYCFVLSGVVDLENLLLWGLIFF